MKYRVTKSYRYTETVDEVEADSESEACDKADSMEGYRNYDDTHVESKAKQIG